MRTYDINIIASAVKDLTKDSIDFDPIDWITNPQNIALVNEFNDLALFEATTPGIVNGHYYFKSRGRQAVVAGKNFLDIIFSDCYNIHIIRGFTPITNLGARWVSRQLGFKSGGVVTIKNKLYELFILHRKEFLNE